LDIKEEKKREEAFITEVWGIMKSNLNIKYGSNKFGFLYESLKTNEFNCQTSAFLVYNIAKQLGIEIQMILVPEHVLVKTENFYFETTYGLYTDKKNYLESKYRYYDILTEDQIQSITYENRGIAKYNLEDYKGAIEDYTRAIKLNPNRAGTYYNRGIAKYNLEDYKGAIEDNDKAIELNPSNAWTYNNRGNAKCGLGDYKEAIEDYTRAIELDPNERLFYSNRGNVKKRIGDMFGANEDFKKAEELPE
jgi:tetratricopeptide (TPR) repeat protein